MPGTITEISIFIEPKFAITKRGALNECEGVINLCGQLINYKKISPLSLRFSCIVMPGKIILFIRLLEKNFYIKRGGEMMLPENSGKDDALYIRLLLTLPMKS
ncbi:MAG: hypothetical protein WCI97_08935 [Bacteroidota bacterium]